MCGLSVVLDYLPLGFVAGVVHRVHARGMAIEPLPVRVPVGAEVGVVVVQCGRVVARLNAHTYACERGLGLAVVANDLKAWRVLCPGCESQAVPPPLMSPSVLEGAQRPRMTSALRL